MPIVFVHNQINDDNLTSPVQWTVSAPVYPLVQGCDQTTLFRALHLQSVSLCGLWLLSEPDVENDCIPQEFGTCDPEDTVRDSQLVENQFVYVSFICVYSHSVFSITISLCPSSFSAVSVSVSQPLPLTDHPDITALVDWAWNTNLLPLTDHPDITALVDWAWNTNLLTYSLSLITLI